MMVQNDKEYLIRVYTNTLKFLERASLQGNEAFAFVEACHFLSLQLQEAEGQSELPLQEFKE